MRRGGVILTAALALAAWCILAAWDNYEVVVPGRLCRSAQLSPAELRGRIEGDGLAAVLSLRDDTNGAWRAGEMAVCEAMGADYLEVPLAGARAPSTEQIGRLAVALRGCRRPLLVHCQHGADRTSLAVAIDLLEGGGDPSRAFSLRRGHLPWLFPWVGCFDEAFDAYRSRRREGGPAGAGP